ncbi:hypothetical protein MUU49_07235 [Scandinavium goeteborgense]|uniref:head-tail joining protein n=1 Tax=Scandinavium goeteborgense TaxID=1851514 RepID=UPI002164F72E|nr:hypothetical protein [Scandinavium goeteborgense]MCS2152376.1 hypothetical protein [Scandinavium goeteborgense]
MNYDDDLSHGDRQMVATFGRPVNLPDASIDNNILAVFDNTYTRTDLPDGGFIQGMVITLTTITSESSGLQSRDTVTVPLNKFCQPDGRIEWSEWTEFTVREIQPDGAGLSVIYLDPVTSSEKKKHSPY